MATLEFTPATDLDHPQLKPYRSLRRRKDLKRQAVFVVEGDKVVQRLLESPYPIESLLITQEWLDRIQDLLQARNDHIRTFVVPKSRIEEITGFGCYQGIKAVARIPQPFALEDVLRDAPRPWLLGALDGISNAENMGVIVRNAAALGAHALIIGETSCSPFLTRAIRTSMGAIFRLPAVEDLPLVQALQQLRQHGVRCLAAHPAAATCRLSQANLRNDCCLVLGSEGQGISRVVLAACDDHISVPMAREVDSLNVSSAAGIFFYEAWRQRQGQGGAIDCLPCPGSRDEALG